MGLTPEIPTGRPTGCVQGRLGGTCRGTESKLWRSITKEKGDQTIQPPPGRGARKAWRNQVISRPQERDSQQVCTTIAVQINAFSRPPNRHALNSERKYTLVSVLLSRGKQGRSQTADEYTHTCKHAAPRSQTDPSHGPLLITINGFLGSAQPARLTDRNYTERTAGSLYPALYGPRALSICHREH